MPIEIRELVIHAEVGATSNTENARQQAPNGGGKIDEATLQEIVARVVEAIKNQQER